MSINKKKFTLAFFSSLLLAVCLSNIARNRVEASFIEPATIVVTNREDNCGLVSVNGKWKEVDHDAYPCSETGVGCPFALYPTTDGWNSQVDYEENLKETYKDEEGNIIGGKYTVGFPWKFGYCAPFAMEWMDYKSWNCSQNIYGKVGHGVDYPHSYIYPKNCNISCIWEANGKTGLYRRKFDVKPRYDDRYWTYEITSASINLFSDNGTAVYINGHLIESILGKDGCYSASVDPAFFNKDAANLLAIQLSNDKSNPSSNPTGLKYTMNINLKAIQLPITNPHDRTALVKAVFEKVSDNAKAVPGVVLKVGSTSFTTTLNRVGSIFSNTVNITRAKAGKQTIVLKAPNHLSRKLTGIKILTSSKQQPFDLTKKPLLGGDFDPNDRVDANDAVVIQSKYGTTAKEADANFDGRVNLFDVGFLINNYGKVGEGS